MEDLKVHEIIQETDENNGLLFKDHEQHLNLGYGESPLEFIISSMKKPLLAGADKLLMTRKSPGASMSLDPDPCCNYFRKKKIWEQERVDKAEKYTLKQNVKVRGKSDDDDDDNIVVKVPRVETYPYHDFPLNILTFFLLLILKSVGFQVNVFLGFLFFPIRIMNFWFMFLMFPFQTLSKIRGKLIKKILGICGSFETFIWNRFRVHKRLVARIVWGLFWSVYVWFLLVGLLVSGFFMGGMIMRRVVEEPIYKTETLNFDYTRATPVAFVPIMASSSAAAAAGLDYSNGEGYYVGWDKSGTRVIAYNHKLQLTVSLILPQSEYNRKLGVFQVKVEFLSADGKITSASSYPCMLRFKSQTLLLAETIFKNVPLGVAGFESDTQILNVKISDYTEGLEPTACIKVSLQQRAEYQPAAGSGIPEIYSTSLALQTKLPRHKQVLWDWRRTVFVWCSMIIFMAELLTALILCRPVVLPRGRPRVVKHVHHNKLLW